MSNSIYELFHANKQMFKPFVNWPERVHLGLNNVDAISNSLLYFLKLEQDEHVLWVCKHKATYVRYSKDRDLLMSDGVIITDKKILYINDTRKEESFCIDWNQVSAIIHQANCFYLLKSPTERSSDLRISDYAMLGEKVENNSPIVSFFRNLSSQNNINRSQENRQTKAKSTSGKGTAPSSNFVNGMSSQEDIKQAYKKLQDILRDSQLEVAELKGVNSQFNAVKSKIALAFDSKIQEANKELSGALKDTVWDNLVIAFFGETNAGKSTIIETFRILFDDKRKKEDGLIVGDGRHDFTKTYEEYHLSISGHPFTLIDVPGIEGDEADFKDVIKTALHKAHCVFYVQGHNKKPDRKTAEKIKKYLGDWVKVYSIYNVRGSVGNYDEEDERETLLTPGVRKMEDLIKAEFKTILGDVYAGNITVQGLLAMSAKASFSTKRDDLARGQQKLLRYFGGSADKVLKFSQFTTLTNIVEQKSSDFKAEIIEANKQKLLSMARTISKDINGVMDSQKNYLSALDTSLRTIDREICKNKMASAARNITNKVNNAIDSAYGNLKNGIFELIEDAPDGINDLAEDIQSEEMQKLESRIKGIVNTELRNIREAANRKIKDLDGVNIKPLRFDRSVDVDTEIDFADAFENLDIDLEDVLGWIGKTARTAAAGAAIGSVIPFLGTAIGAGVGAVVGGFFHACSGDGGKADARKSVSDAISEAKRRAKSNTTSMLKPILRDIDNQKRQLSDSIRKETDNIEELRGTIDDFSDDIIFFVNGLKLKQHGRI